MRSILALAALLFYGAAAPIYASTNAAPPEIKACPSEFPVDAVKLTPVPPGWVGIGPAKALLTSADVILGPTTRPGVQIGKQRKTRDGDTMTFEQLYLPAYEPVEKWLACRHGPHLALAQRLPEKTDRCVVTYFRNAYSGLDLQVACHTQP